MPYEIGVYTTVRSLGEGGFGKVKLATAPDGSFVAIKVFLKINPVDDGLMLADIENEAHYLLNLNHPHIV
jgi:serine/threonine protein kinase